MLFEIKRNCVNKTNYLIEHERDFYKSPCQWNAYTLPVKEKK